MIAPNTPVLWFDGKRTLHLRPAGKRWSRLGRARRPRCIHLVRYGGCLARHSHLHGAIIPTSRQQGVDETEANTDRKPSRDPPPDRAWYGVVPSPTAPLGRDHAAVVSPLP
jgi:hypothetical protein